MTAKAIMRVGKLKSLGSVGGSEKHTARLQDTPNADPYKENIRLIGDNDDPELEKIVLAKIADNTKHKPRKDAVLCSEIFLSASPEYFRPHNPSHAGEWNDSLMWNFANASKKWLQDNFGDKCVRAELHLDESTPHIHAYIVPLNDKTKQLSHKAMFGGDGRQASIKLSKFQDSYAKALAPLGIERGVKGSQATHTKVKEYYEAVNKEPLTLELERLAPKQGETAQQLFERIKKDPAIQTINHQLADRSRMIGLEKRASRSAIASEKLRQQLENHVEELESENFYWKQQADQLRDLPLEDVAWHLGLDKADKGDNRWKGLGQVININGSKWYDFTAEKGGGGAIDLVMHVAGCNFRSSLAWLCDRFGSEGMLRASRAKVEEQASKIVATEPVPQFVPPLEDSPKWLHVKNYLIKARGLPENFVDGLHSKGWLYADEQQNAVFTMRELPYCATSTFNNDGAKRTANTGAESSLSMGATSGDYETTTGAFLRGTRGEDNSFMGYVSGTKRTEGWFYFHFGGKATDEVEKVIICKSPIDAISCCALSLAVSSGVPQTRMMFLAVDSLKSLPLDFLKDIPAITVACDNDDGGRNRAKAIKELLPQTVIKQSKAADWNTELLEYQRQNLVRAAEGEKKKSRGLER
ncbi:MobV family relaxase [Calothrix sp. PCC 6303]|uniref:MobV family relaxase n=1 Tax=Calothrix sp. PCC 6303 TaxID=1170562 RepID=UPI0002A04954|nr:MobV family relaxase [Calothrix sp. PCC 6303]AFZ04645.1 plasmid recombination protein [Calothrix sp. PCC 6303]